MKKIKEIYPPLQMIKDYNKKGRITWEQMDEMRTVLRKKGSGKTSDLAYITLLEVLFTMNYYDKIPDDEYENAVRIANIVSALASWRISKQADIQPADPKPTGTLRRIEDIKDCYREIRKWDVGMRMVSQNRRRTEKHIKKTKQQSGRSNYEPVVHYRLAPHVRRGHWHTYWTGKKDGSEKRKLILKWIPFTYVNVGKLEELPTVVNVMKNQ